MRLNKYIANNGGPSRRKSDELIFAGRVSVNGEIILEPGFRLNDEDTVKIDGREVISTSRVYYMLNKPVGYMSSLSDPNYDRFVTDLIIERQRIYPVGRLDIDSRGLLILTNDGELTQKLTHPSFGVEKSYIIKTKDPLSFEDLRRLEGGIRIDNGPPVTSRIKKLANKEYEIIIFEGRNRQIRKMIAGVDNEVEDLFRIRIGPLEIGNLADGAYRPLTSDEIRSLKIL